MPVRQPDAWIVSWLLHDDTQLEMRSKTFASREAAAAHVAAIAAVCRQIMMAQCHLTYDDPRHVRPPRGRTKGL